MPLLPHPERRAPRPSTPRRRAPGLLPLVLLAAASPAAAQWHFTDVSAAAGVDAVHTNQQYVSDEERMCGGVACGDFDNDGWIDLYHLGGDLGVNALLRNNGDGTFTDVSGAAGVAIPNGMNMGATFCDWNGDGWLDLFVGGAQGTKARMFESNGDGTFRQTTDSSGVALSMDTYTGSFGDIDNDGDLDMAVGHWGLPEGPGHFWRNDGMGTFCTRFASVDSQIGYVGYSSPPTDWTFTYNFVDLDSDGWTDFVSSSDFGTSHVFMNDGDGTFTETTDDAVVTDDNGMGSCVGDYDNDGDLDWFVTSIWDPVDSQPTGNRLYRNDGAGVLADVTDEAGVRDGMFGWSASMQDLNNDGWLDIVHVNGWDNKAIYLDDPVRVFVSNGDGTFTESAAALGAADTGQGRGLAVFDYDRDGDLDLYIFNVGQPAVLLRNDGPVGHWLGVKLVGPSPNTQQVGARIRATVAGATQLRELRCGNNYGSHDPVEAHFGLGTATIVDELAIEWTDGSTTVMHDVAADQLLTIDQAGAVDAPLTDPPARRGVAFLGAAPNPVRDGTRIEFRLARAGPATVKVHDAAGRLVRTVADGERPAGRQAVVWDGRDAEGHAVASGVYLVEIRSGDERASGRVTVLR